MREADEILPSLMDAIDFPGDGRQQAVFGGDRLRAGGVLHVLFQSTGLQLVAEGGGTTVLPHDGVVDRLAGLTVPYQGCLPLVGDADAGNIGRRNTRAFNRIAAGRNGGVPQVHGVMFNPAIIWEMLSKFLLGTANDAA